MYQLILLGRRDYSVFTYLVPKVEIEGPTSFTKYPILDLSTRKICVPMWVNPCGGEARPSVAQVDPSFIFVQVPRASLETTPL